MNDEATESRRAVESIIMSPEGRLLMLCACILDHDSLEWKPDQVMKTLNAAKGLAEAFGMTVQEMLHAISDAKKAKKIDA